MGQSLSNPVVEKLCEGGDTENISYGISAMQGWRTNMEDAHTVSLNFSVDCTDWNFFAIFDGHAGAEASKYSSDNMLSHISRLYRDYTETPVKISECVEFAGLSNDLPPHVYNLAVATHDAFVQLDEDMRDNPKLQAEPISCGTTALALITTPTHFIFANCGDSRAIFSRNNKLFFETKDHKPMDELEKARIIAAGSTVCIDRVNGNLAVSRALGDFTFKSNLDLPLIKQAVSPEPTITVIPRQNDDQFAVLACDGIWDVLTSNDVNEMVLNRLRVTHDAPEISRIFIDTALHLDSRDNMTFMLILFPSIPDIDQEKLDKDMELDYNIAKEVESIMMTEDKNSGSNVIIKKINDELSLETKEVFNYKIPLITSLMDKMDPNRDKTKDFQSPFGFRTLPHNLQIIQNVMNRYGLGSPSEAEDS